MCNPGYSFLRGDVPGGISSFTQMVWKPTKRFGIGKATSREDGMFCTYIVGLYREKGNSDNEYYTNVLKGDFDFGYCESLGKQHRLSYERYQRHKIENVDMSGSELTTRTKNADTLNNTVRNTKSNTMLKTLENSTTTSIRATENKTINQNLTADKSDKLSENSKNNNNANKTIGKSPETVKLKTDRLTGNNKVSPKGLIVSIDVINSSSDTKSKRNRIPFKIKKWKKNKKSNKKKKVVIDNLMQLNDFVMKVNKKKKRTKKFSTKHKQTHNNKGKHKKKKS